MRIGVMGTAPVFKGNTPPSVVKELQKTLAGLSYGELDAVLERVQILKASPMVSNTPDSEYVTLAGLDALALKQTVQALVKSDVTSQQVDGLLQKHTLI